MKLNVNDNYVLASSSLASELEFKVNELVLDGYRPHGLLVVEKINLDIVFIQPMWKEPHD